MKKCSIKKYLVLFGLTVAFAAVGAMSSFAAKKRLDTPTDPYWSNTTKANDDGEKEGAIARWDEVEGAYNYLVYLYHEDSDSYYAKQETKKTYVNLRSLMKKPGDYTFKVCAQAKKNSKEYSTSYWSEMSDTHYISESAAENADLKDDPTTFIVTETGWLQDGRGWWYKNTNGSYPSNGWFQDPASSAWYYMDAEGYMMTGWVEDGGKKYYLDAAGTPSGSMATGERVIDGVTYQFGTDGALIEQ
jgi:glucan-binding YG repeat protein